MFLVPIYHDKSEIEGVGCFASENISVNTLVMEANPLVDIPVDIENIPEPAKSWMKKHGHFNTVTGQWVTHLDGSNFMNHADNANLKHQIDISGIERFYATKDILQGEELTINYSQAGDSTSCS